MNIQFKKYSTKFATLLTSTFLLLASAPIVSASEDIFSDEPNQTENQHLESDENEINTVEESDLQMTVLSSVEDELLTDNQVEPAELIESGTEEETDNQENSADEDSQDPTIVDTEEWTDITPISFEVEYIEDNTLPEGQEIVTQEGVNGELVEVYTRVTYSDGAVENILESSETVDPINQIIRIGTMIETPEIPEEPIEPEPEPEPIPDVTIEPILEPNPIQPNASTITGVANPNAHVIVIYPGTSRQRAATVDTEGNWIIRNVGGDNAYLTEGAEVPMQLQLVDNGREMTYSYAFQVGDESATDLIEESQTVYVSDSTEIASSQNNESTTGKESEGNETEELEILPETGEDDHLDMLGFASITAGLSLMVIGKTKKEQA